MFVARMQSLSTVGLAITRICVCAALHACAASHDALPSARPPAPPPAPASPAAPPVRDTSSPAAKEWTNRVRAAAKACSLERSACPTELAKLKTQRRGVATPDEVDRAMLELVHDPDRVVQLFAAELLAVAPTPALRSNATWVTAIIDLGEHDIAEDDVQSALDLAEQLATADLEATRMDEQVRAMSDAATNFHAALMMSMIQHQSKAPRMMPLLDHWIGTARGQLKQVLLQTAARIMEREEVGGYCAILARSTDDRGQLFRREAIQGLLGARGCATQRDAAVKAYAAIVLALDPRDADSAEWIGPVYPQLLHTCVQGTTEAALAEQAAERIARETRWPSNYLSNDRSNAIETMAACDRKAAGPALRVLARDADAKVREAAKTALAKR